MIHFVSGDIFKNRFNAKSFGHGVNTTGVIGGIATQVFEKYPKLKKQYLLMCKEAGAILGGRVQLYWHSPDFAIFNMFTQINPGPNARLDFIENCCLDCLMAMNCLEITSLAVPAIGAGIGGLDLEDVKAVFSKVFKDSKGDVYFYEKYEHE